MQYMHMLYCTCSSVLLHHQAVHEEDGEADLKGFAGQAESQAREDGQTTGQENHQQENGESPSVRISARSLIHGFDMYVITQEWLQRPESEPSLSSKIWHCNGPPSCQIHR